jgi:hypothetical protein
VTACVDVVPRGVMTLERENVVCPLVLTVAAEGKAAAEPQGRPSGRGVIEQSTSAFRRRAGLPISDLTP